MEFKIMEFGTYLDVLLTINVTFTLVWMLFACLCCKKKMPKNELLGLEGMVKLKNPDEVVVVTTLINKSESQADLNLSTVSNGDSEKRASTAAHRSLPDIPIAEVNGDTGSELYETVADKRLMEAQNKSPTQNLKKQISVSQHSSISQADDVSSPYSRVKNSPHDYAKVFTSEHPYAQLNAPSTSAAAVANPTNANATANQVSSEAVNRSSHHSISIEELNDDEDAQVDIPAASAIAGMISASQDLPYMTPPVANQHFSGDSQDSSKGYTSISVREPLANILAQQPIRPVQHTSTLPRDVNDSHYATVSDDSDETYAAIEDPNMRNNINTTADIYTSGSETYAQIQPMQSVLVSVEINNTSAPSNYHSVQSINNNNNNSSNNNNNNTSSNVTAQIHSHTNSNYSEHTTPIPHTVDSLRTQMHSRQASSSSNNSSSVGNLGSPKPEKRQANSPLPPTPKSSSTLHTASNSNLASGRNSVISVIELTGTVGDGNEKQTSVTTETSPVKKNKSLSPSKDIEGMYAKVMKKNKFSTRDSPPSQNNSPVLTRKFNSSAMTTIALGVTPLDATTATLMEANKISIASNEKNRSRCNSYGAKDHGYETIPADANRKSDCYTNILQKERQQMEINVSTNIVSPALNCVNTKPPNNSVTQSSHASASSNNSPKYQSDKHYETIAGAANSSDPGYETLQKAKHQPDGENGKKSSDYDPNYELLKGPNNPNSAGLSDDGYAKVLEKKRPNIDEDSIDGYSKVKGDETEDGYSTIRDTSSTHHNYASILETKNATNEIHISTGDITMSSPVPDLLTLSASSTPVKTSVSAPIEHRMRPNELPSILSPTSFTSSSQLNTSSAPSSANLTTTSTMSTLSSRQTPSSSQYESLTGSDTDPNYESVSYVQTNRSTSELHPYERLQTDYSDTQLSSPRTPPEVSIEQSTISTTGAAVVLNVITATTTESTSTSSSLVSPKKAHAATSPKSPTENHTEVMVDDYFQV